MSKQQDISNDYTLNAERYKESLSKISDTEELKTKILRTLGAHGANCNDTADDTILHNKLYCLITNEQSLKVFVSIMVEKYNVTAAVARDKLQQAASKWYSQIYLNKISITFDHHDQQSAELEPIAISDDINDEL